MMILYAFLLGASVFGSVMGFMILLGATWLHMGEKYDWFCKPLFTEHTWSSYISNGTIALGVIIFLSIVMILTHAVGNVILQSFRVAV